MMFSIDKNTIQNALETVSKAIKGSEITMNLLKNVLIDVKKGEVTLTCSNLNNTIKTKFATLDSEDGQALVDAKLMLEYIKKLAGNGNIIIEKKDIYLEIKKERSKSEIILGNIDEYPDISIDKNPIILNVVQSELKTALQETLYAASSDQCRPILTGINFDIRDGQMTLVALDAYRLAGQKIAVDYEENKSIVIPAEELKSVEKLLGNNEENVKIEVGENATTFVVADTSVSIRMLQGEYVKYGQILEPYKNNSIIIRVSREEFLESISRVALLSANKDNTSLIKMKLNNENIVISANNSMGSAEDEITPVKYSGSELEIAFNSQYWIQILNSIEDDEIEVKFNRNIDPVIISKIEDDSYFGLILPVRIA